ncbi:MAG: Asp-tRNA(Asn)/Glu-tRNA(Gln) amidotransferase GatCAB subunit A [candidate division SR1 bacterium]|nr:MAG: Asp-tRNA(Asn)/Glu-tRNA(Gln) amidotransferase GatCAB subunit A [candidate division SR1 bacterium]
MQLTIASYLDGIKKQLFTPKEVLLDYQKRAKTLNPDLNACVRFNDDYVAIHAEEFATNSLAALPIMVKDNILIKGELATCSSKMLENYQAPYTATCMENLEKAGALMIGQTNMDEFAMGGSTETSYYGKTLNPHGQNRIPGGSSGGAAVAVAADMAIAALGTDTGGSVRQPAALCGIVGFKPSYGAISRYGVVAMASSLDQVGIFSKTVEDVQLLFPYLVGYDPKDSTSSLKADQLKEKKSDFPPSYQILVPQEALGEGVDSQIKELFFQKLEQLKAQGHQVDIKPLPILKYALATYYTLMPAEVSTNLSRFDGIRFGHQGESQDFTSLDEYYATIRAEGFGEEAKRRILLGTFVLSSANYEGYYLKALKAQKKLKADLDQVFGFYDIILTPTTPEPAWKIGSKVSDPLKMYLADLYTVPANLAGLPAISVPLGFVKEGEEMLPVGIQAMSKQWSDLELLDFASKL